MRPTDLIGVVLLIFFAAAIVVAFMLVIGDVPEISGVAGYGL